MGELISLVLHMKKSICENLASVIEDVQGDNVLDMGCGPGIS